MDNLFRIYNDGNHFVGIKKFIYNSKKSIKMNKMLVVNDYFNRMYYEYYVRQNESKHFFIDRIKCCLNNEFSSFFNEMNVDSYISNRMTAIQHNVYSRVKRLKRKAYLNNWNYFITITYDSNKMTEYAFRTKLKKCLSNLSTRRKWRYMGVFEYSPMKHRLHFHAIIYVPKNEMVGNLIETNDYSTKYGKIQKCIQNTFFAKTFGRNDFQNINPVQLKHGDTINYITKYLFKTNEYIVYSRNIPSELIMNISDNDIITTYTDFCIKYILFDDVINSDYDYEPFVVRYVNIDDLE